MSEHKQPDEQPKPEDSFDFFGEMNKLGQNLERTIKSTLESNQAKSFQRDVSAGMKEFFTQLQGITRSVQDDERMRDMTTRGQQAINEFQEKVQENRALQDLQATMTRSIAYLNSQLNEFNETMQKDSEQSGDAGAQSVPIDEEEETPQTPGSNTAPHNPQTPGGSTTSGAPSTGPTIRLDPDDPAEGNEHKS